MEPIKETNEEYHRHPAVSASTLKPMLDTPAHYLAALTTERKETPALRLGTLIHKAILEPRAFLDNFVIAPKVDRRTSVGKATWAAFQEGVLPSQIVVTEDEADAVTGAANAILNHPLASVLLQGGISERSFYFKDPKTGLDCKCRPDFFRDDLMIVDVKSCDDASKWRFEKQVMELHYDLQAAFYVHGMEQVFGKRCKFVWLAVEKKAPFGINLVTATEYVIESGQAKFEHCLELVKRCREMDFWPSYNFNFETGKYFVSEMFLPDWRIKELGITL